MSWICVLTSGLQRAPLSLPPCEEQQEDGSMNQEVASPDTDSAPWSQPYSLPPGAPASPGSPTAAASPHQSVGP